MASSTSISYKPKHAQPFTLKEAMNLEIETLVNEIHRLENSITHLQDTQRHLLEYLNSPEGEDDDEILLAIRENEDVIASQKERIEIIKLALLSRLGSETSLKHYGLESKTLFGVGLDKISPEGGTIPPEGIVDLNGGDRNRGENEDGTGIHL